MTPCALAALLACAGTAARAADGNALHSDACRAALDRLGAAESRQAAVPSATGRPAASSKALQQAQREAANACLGGADEVAATPRQAQPVPVLPRVPAAPPVVVPRVALPMPSAPLGPPVVVPAPPPFVTACDATGCWGSDGRRLDRVGPDLYYRDHQLCNARGGMLHCP